MAKGLFDGYWQTVTSGSYFWDAEWRQRRDINGLEASAEWMQANQAQMAASTLQLQRHVMDLTMTVSVLVQMLAETSGLDPAALHARVESEIAKSRPPPSADIPDPWAQQPSPTVAATPTVPAGPEDQLTCVKCGASVPRSRTTITERGTLCDTCAG